MEENNIPRIIWLWYKTQGSSSCYFSRSPIVSLTSLLFFSALGYKTPSDSVLQPAAMNSYSGRFIPWYSILAMCSQFWVYILCNYIHPHHRFQRTDFSTLTQQVEIKRTASFFCFHMWRYYNSVSPVLPSWRYSSQHAYVLFTPVTIPLFALVKKKCGLVVGRSARGHCSTGSWGRGYFHGYHELQLPPFPGKQHSKGEYLFLRQ
jgi:hypothetical protein